MKLVEYVDMDKCLGDQSKRSNSCLILTKESPSEDVS